MMNESNVIDVSDFFLFEATGDSSEIQSSVLDEDSSAAAAADQHQWSDDDAQSCSGRVFGEVDDAGDGDEVKQRVSRCLSFEENYEYDDGIGDAAGGGGGGNETDEEDDDEEEEVNQRWMMSVKRGNTLMRQQQSKIWPLGVVRTRTTRIKARKSKVCNLEMMSEKDRDRLFWEACLSSS